MKAIINGYYEIEIVELTDDQDKLSLKVSYSRRDYPDFHQFMGNVVIEKRTVTYRDDQREARVLVTGCVFMMLEHMLDDSVRNDDIILRESTFGKIVADVPLEKRKEFSFNQAYGSIEVKYIDATT